MRISNHKEAIKEMIVCGSPKKNVSISVVVVAYNVNFKLIDCLKSLFNQTIKDFEIIVVDNGNNEMVKEEVKKFNIKYILLNKNYGPSFGRNVGIYYSKGNVVVFIDDDAVVKNDCLENHLKFYTDNNIYAVRGRAYALHGKLYSYIAANYNLGDKIQKRADFGLEGNLSVRKDILVKVDGFDPQMFGGEGDDLRKRILETGIDENAFLYSPGAIIYHDYADSLKKFMKKAIRYGENRGMLERKNKKNILSLFSLYKLKTLLIPFKISTWRKYRNLHNVSFSLYLKISLIELFNILIRKIYETKAYLVDTVKEQASRVKINAAVDSAISTSQYEISGGNILEDFENSTDWTIAGNGATVANNTTQYMHGSKSVKLTARNENVATIEKKVNWDLSSVHNFILWFYVEVISFTVSDIGVHFSSTSDFSKYMKGAIAYTQLRNGWNRILMYKTDNWTSVGGEAWSNTMIRVKFILIPKASSKIKVILKSILHPKISFDINLSFDDLRTNYISSKAKIIFTFDDNRASIYGKAYPIMKKNNQAGCIGVVTDAVGKELPYEHNIPCSTLRQIKEMYDNGWDMVNHTKTHIDLTDSAADLEKEVNVAYNYLVSNGFGKSAKFFIYPKGSYNSKVISKVKENHVWARTIKVSPEQNPQITRYDNMEFETSATYIKNTTTLAQAKISVDRIINSGGCLVFIFHGIVDSNPGTWEWLTSDLQSLSDYIKTKIDASEVDVETLSTYFNSFIKIQSEV